MKVIEHGQIRLLDLEPRAESFEEELLSGLLETPKRIPCKFFYDEEGARLFEQICELPEYYLTRAEAEILSVGAGEIADELGSGCLLVELGSGTGKKFRLLLDDLIEPAGYVPVDISREQLLHSADSLAALHPDLPILPVCADYTRELQLPEFWFPVNRTVFFFPGSTIGNFDPPAAREFLRKLAQFSEGETAILIGVDLKKNPDVLEAAYNDSKGVTAAFNLNLLARANRELDAEFDLTGFEHLAFYNERHGRIEMHLVSTVEQSAYVAGETIDFHRGEHILTEYSYKYSIAEFQELARGAGFEPVACWTDDQEWFSVQLFEKTF
jgi:dimethylhistidine N-methyltransferase